ncbi:hypothetical protein GCM10023231_29060 [Olivibacter ginsenosidimutans]|uniref:HTH araC/xylS-type domain-containing protein n=2 Tax=Olivibacter ginsenosidimutans TaxID=1176537 RepID=A0ABP9BS93_9SPHI
MPLEKIIYIYPLPSNNSIHMQREEQITAAYFDLLDQHLDDLLTGKAMQMFELNQIADRLSVPHKQLIQLMKKQYGQHPCFFYDQKILDKSKQLLRDSDWPVAKIALRLTYDPSNFSKFFKKYTQQTPGQFRRQAYLEKSKKEKSSP